MHLEIANAKFFYKVYHRVKSWNLMLNKILNGHYLVKYTYVTIINVLVSIIVNICRIINN